MTCLDSVMDIELISSVFFGLIVGVAAKLIMPGKDPGGIFVTILLGIAGAVLGGWVKTRLDYGPQEQAAGWIMRQHFPAVPVGQARGLIESGARLRAGCPQAAQPGRTVPHSAPDAS